ncbi:polysaccharide deacetylase family protein [Clostridium pasteurianum]|uniref:Putative xylanase/chitin deacetylase n=1 Tax=Clostridium pasteurianum BC1 TaxID=86416 RepID=R4K1W7_CLOPA|nr:polysaccharide deacetylase family protein [Clostridium pasteurianum]AGK95776.1 putative xylanase/chitin deacetylase [Clostridium pasteurianum BC1]
MIKKFKLLSTLILVILSITLFGCSSTPNNNNNNDSKKPVQNTTKVSEQKLPEESFKAPFKAANQGVPVLMYHSISFEKNNPLKVPPEQLEEEFKYLKDNGYTTISLDDLYNYFEDNAQIPEKSIVLTFDDGYEDNYTALFPLLKKYGLRATVFVITGYVDKMPAYLTSSQLKEMNSYGVDIESHTVNHDHLKTLTKDKQLATLTESKAFLEKLLNKKINYIAYPYGEYDNNTLECAKQAGYKMALSTDGRWSMKKNGIFSLDRVYISSQFNMDIFKDRISNPNYKFQ